ncbi:MAG: FliA/WhiG family RNA polymerase sigma factor, partial [Desulfobacterales bacterium]
MEHARAYDQRDDLVRQHLDLAEFVVYRMRPQIPASVSVDELKSAAMHGLMEAATRFDPSRGVMFKTFAEPRIRGAVRDELRKMDWFSRSMRDKHNRVLKEIKHLEQKLGREPEEAEIADSMDLDIEDYRQMLNEIGHLGIVSLQEVLDSSYDRSGTTFMDQLGNDGQDSPEDALGRRESVEHIAGMIDGLSEKERLVVTLFYYEEFTQKEIAG